MKHPSNYINRVGLAYGQLTVISRAPNDPNYPSHAQWLCRCSCGNERTVKAGSLQAGQVTTCGQRRHPRKPKQTPAESSRLFRQRHAAEIKVSNHNYYLANRETRLAYGKDYYAANKAERLAYQKEWREARKK